MDEGVSEIESKEIDDIIDEVCGQINNPLEGLYDNSWGNGQTIIDGLEYQEEPYETVENLKKELSNLKQIVKLLKKMD